MITTGFSRSARAARFASALLAAVCMLGCLPELPGRLSAADVGPASDMRAPDVQDARTGVGGDSALPDVLEPEPPVDMALPEPEPGMDMDLPEPEPSVDMEPPEPDMDLPELDMDPPGLDMGLPELDMDPPELDMSPPELDMAPPEFDLSPPDLNLPGPEVCNGLDDDQNGVVDDAPVCGRVIAENCRVFLGWADNDNGPADGSETWGACPDNDTDDFDGDEVACRGTRGQQLFRRLQLKGNVNDDDDMGIAFQCEGGPPGVAEWIESSCEVWIGQADGLRADLGRARDDWGGCLANGGNPRGGWTCESSGRDGLFHRMSLTGDVNYDDAFAVAFRCADPDDEARAAAAQASAAVFLAFDGSPDDGSAVDLQPRWSACPGERRDALDDGSSERCVSSAFDGRFHRFTIEDGFFFDVTGEHAFGIALFAHPDSP